MKSNKFEFHEHKLSKKNKPINNQRQKPQTQRKKKIEKRKKKNYLEILVLTKKRRRKIQKRNNGFSKVALADSGGGRGCYVRAMTAGGFLYEGDEGEGGFWRGRPGARREGVVRGKAGSGWGGCATLQQSDYLVTKSSDQIFFCRPISILGDKIFYLSPNINLR
jgi:hypothetical protein